MRVLIDTNVIIDALTSREPWKESAEKISSCAVKNGKPLAFVYRKMILRNESGWWNTTQINVAQISRFFQDACGLNDVKWIKNNQCLCYFLIVF